MRIHVAIAAFFLQLLGAVPTALADTHQSHEHAQQSTVHSVVVTDTAPEHERAGDEHSQEPSPVQKSPEKEPQTKEPQAKESQAKPSAHSPENTVSYEHPPMNLPSDVRVLIDISGSMKKTDPNNLRKPALDLIVRLLPDKSRAGVWIFGNEVNMLMAHNVVDAGWRKQAALKAEKINSIALYTNIGKALDEVSFDKKALSPDYKTHIVLLTDGVVDISKEAVDNIKERQRILTDVLPGLKRAGYTVHTIALSADADADLLKKISVATDGVFTTAQSADELTNTFLKIFDQAVPAERVPLEDNGFLVDASVKEFTALIFRKPGVDKTIIIAPDGKEFSATSPSDGINWYRTDKYDLITSDAPKAGKWKIKTEITPQSRITVVSNLQLIMQPLKNNIHSNDSLALNYSFQENGKTVTNIDFLNLLETNAIIAKEGVKENTALALEMPKPPADGVYHQSLKSFAEIGDYDIHIFVDGKTFKREFKHSLSVRDSLLAVEKKNSTTDAGKITYSYKVTTDEKLVNINKTTMNVTVKNATEAVIENELKIVDNNHWDFSFVPEHAAEYHVIFHGLGEMVDGDEFDETLNADTFSYQEKIVVVKPPEPKKVAAPIVVEKHEAVVDSDNSKIMYIAIAVANLVVVVLGYFVYRLFFGGKATDEIAELEKTLSLDTKETPEKIVDKKPPEKLKIDLSEEKPADIPMSDTLGMDTLFPLDDMEDEK